MSGQFHESLESRAFDLFMKIIAWLFKGDPRNTHELSDGLIDLFRKSGYPNWHTFYVEEAQVVSKEMTEKVAPQIGITELFDESNLEKTIEMLQTLWDKRNNAEKREVVNLLYSNCMLDGPTLSATYKKPFSYIAEGTQTQKWRALRDSNSRQ